jgi:aspartyl-tRNA(Asn)/glutamyl-tRNA(Gln) amidotransferase subunit A
MCRTVEDCALMLQVLAGFDPEDPGSADAPVPDFSAGLGKDIRGIRIGYLRNFHDRALAPGDEMRIALEAAVRHFESLGTVVSDADIGGLEDFNDVKNIIAEAEFCAVHEKDYLERIDVYGENLRFKAAPGLVLRAVDYIQAQRQRARMIARLRTVMRDFDVLLTVTTFEPSPEINPAGKGRRAIQLPNCTQAFNVTGSPSISVCNGFSGKGMPLAMLIIGRHFDEATLLRVAHAYEASTPWHERHPDI